VILGQEESTLSVVNLSVLDDATIERDGAPIGRHDFATGPVARFVCEGGRPEGNNAVVRFDRAEIRAGVFDIDDEGIVVSRFDRAVVFEAAKGQRA